MQKPKDKLVESLIEQSLFTSRWILAPMYLGLCLSLILLAFKFAQKSWVMLSDFITIGTDDTIVGILSLVDLTLMGNLLLMIMLGGYRNFVSRLDFNGHEDTPEWISHVGFGNLKLKLMSSIVAISAIELLRSFMFLEQVSDRALWWEIGIHFTFVLSALLLAGTDLLTSKSVHK